MTTSLNAVPVDRVVEIRGTDVTALARLVAEHSAEIAPVVTRTSTTWATPRDFAVAMADHPVAPPYKGLDAMPDCAWRIKAAVRTLRAVGREHGLNGRIVPFGFSRGSGMALMLTTTAGMAEFDGHGLHPSESSHVDGAVVTSGRFTYLDLRAEDPMIPRYDKAWGTRAEHEDMWRAHGALDYIKGQLPPLFLSINNTESPDALHQMKVLRKRLADHGADETFIMDRTPRGHKVPLDPDLLRSLTGYLRDRLADRSDKKTAP